MPVGILCANHLAPSVVGAEWKETDMVLHEDSINMQCMENTHTGGKGSTHTDHGLGLEIETITQ